MKPPLSYYGGKQNLISEILPLIPKHNQYVEPFVGGAALFFAKEASDNEVINDFDGRLINFYEVLQNDFESLQSKIQQTLHSEFYHKKAKKILKPFKENGDKLENAWAYWVATQMSFTFKLFGGFAFDNGERCAPLTNNKRESFTNVFHERIKNCEIFNRDAIEVIKLKDDTNTFLYLDPPYAESNCGQYDDLKEVYYRLLNVLPSLKSKWLMSSYPSQQLTTLRKEYNWFSKDINQNLSVSGKLNKGKRKTECLTWNYNLDFENRDLFNSIIK